MKGEARQLVIRSEIAERVILQPRKNYRQNTASKPRLYGLHRSWRGLFRGEVTWF